MHQFDIKTSPASDLRIAYLNERTWLGGSLLKACVPLLLTLGTLLTAAISSSFGEGNPEWFTTAISWINTIVAFTVAAGLVMFGGQALEHFKRMSAIRAELQSRGYGSIQ